MGRVPDLCYAGTNIRLIRGGAPEAPPSGGPDSGAGAGGPPPADSGAGAPARNWEKDYGELKARHDPYESLRHPTENRSWTPQEINQTIDYARTIYQQIQAGQLVPKSAAPEKPAAPAGDPFEKFDEMEPRQQAQFFQDRVLDAGRRELIEPLNKRFDEFQRGQAQQQQLLLKVIQQMVKDPTLDPTDILTKATELASLPPEKLLERAVEMVTEPQRRERDIKQAVEAELARRTQEEEKKAVALLTTRPGPHLVKPKTGTRGDRLSEAFSKMVKKGDNISRNAG